jgi:hypothetical protein
VVLPDFNADAKPAGLIVAMVVVDDVQITLVVKFCVELSTERAGCRELLRAIRGPEGFTIRTKHLRD